MFSVLNVRTVQADTIFQDGFETGFVPWTGTGGTPTQSTTEKHNETYSMMCDSAGEYAHKTFDGKKGVILTVFVWLNSYPDVSTRSRIFALLNSSSSVVVVDLRKTAGGSNYVRLKRFAPSEVNDDYYADYGTSTWINFTLQFINNATVGEYRLWIDGVERCTMSGLDTSNAGDITRIHVGLLDLQYTLTAYFDSVLLQDKEGGGEGEEESQYFQAGWDASGVDVSDTGFQTSGSYFDTQHIQLIAESNGSTVRVYVCRESWEQEYTTNIKGYAYSDYILWVTQTCHQYGLRVWLTWQPFFDGYETWYPDGQNSFSPWELKRAIIRNDAGTVSLWNIDSPVSLGDNWRSWIQEVLTKVPADATDTMCETTTTVTDAQYWTFSTSTIEAIRSVYPNIFVFVYGKGGNMDIFQDESYGQLPYDDIGYNIHEYYNPNLGYAYCQSYKNGDFATAKTQLYSHLDSRFGDLLGPADLWIGEFGAYRKTSGSDYFVNWEEAVQGFYDYCSDRDVGCTQYAFGKTTFPMLDLATHQELNSAGQKWSENMPSPPADEQSPTYSNVAWNQTDAGSVTKFSCKAMDNVGLSNFVFATNNTGTWVFDNETSISGFSDWANVSKTLNSTVGMRVEFKWTIEDTSDNSLTTSIYYLTTGTGGSDTTSPTYSSVAYNDTRVGEPCEFSVKWEDETGLNYSVFSTNNTGTYVNETVELSGNPAWHNVTKTLNDTANLKIGFLYYANDTSGNWETTETYFITLEDIPSLVFLAQDLDGNSLNDVVINGTQTTDLGYYEWQNLTYNQVYTFVVETPASYYPAWVLNVDGSFSWNGTHFIINHNLTESQTEYLRIDFIATSQPYVNYTNARLVSGSLTSTSFELVAEDTGTKTINVSVADRGEPHTVSGLSGWNFDASTNIYSITVAFSSSQTIHLSWGSVVGTSLNTGATYLGYQRKTFYAQSRFWVFYSDGQNIVYRSSTDGTNWGNSTVVVENRTSGNYLSLVFESPYVHYVSAYSQSIKYRRGEPLSNGSITWDAEQTIGSAPRYYSRPYISLDSDGYPWIGCTNGTLGGNYYPYVLKSSLKNGSWSTSSGFPYQLYSVAPYTDWVIIPTRQGSSMWVVYAVQNDVIHARKYTGSWESIKTISSAITGSPQKISVTGTNSTINVAFVSNNQIQHVQHDGTEWKSSVVVVDEIEWEVNAVLSQANTTLYLLYQDENVIFLKRYIGSAWELSSAWLSASPMKCSETSFYDAQSNRVGIAWTNQSKVVKFAWFYTITSGLFLLEGRDGVTLSAINYDDNSGILSCMSSGSGSAIVRSPNGVQSISVNGTYRSWTSNDIYATISSLTGTSTLTFYTDVKTYPSSTTKPIDVLDVEDTMETEAPDFPAIGFIVVVGGVLLFGVGAIFKKIGKTRTRGISNLKASRPLKSRGIRRPAPKRRSVPSEPKRSKRTGRFQ